MRRPLPRIVPSCGAAQGKTADPDCARGKIRNQGVPVHSAAPRRPAARKAILGKIRRLGRRQRISGCAGALHLHGNGPELSGTSGGKSCGRTARPRRRPAHYRLGTPRALLQPPAAEKRAMGHHMPPVRGTGTLRRRAGSASGFPERGPQKVADDGNHRMDLVLEHVGISGAVAGVSGPPPAGRHSHDGFRTGRIPGLLDASASQDRRILSEFRRPLRSLQQNPGIRREARHETNGQTAVRHHS